MQNNIDLKQYIAVWDKLSKEQQQLLNESAVVKQYETGQIVAHTAVQCMGVMIIKQGQLRVYVTSDDGREVTLYRLHNGDLCVMSASCVLESISFDVTIEAMQNTTVVNLPVSALKSVQQQNPYFDAYLYRAIVERFSDVMFAVQQILFLGADKRVANFLYDEMLHSDGNMEIQYSHEQIAKLIGSAREVVSKTLKYFEQENIVKLERRKIIITDLTKLKQLTE